MNEHDKLVQVLTRPSFDEVLIKLQENRTKEYSQVVIENGWDLDDFREISDERMSRDMVQALSTMKSLWPPQLKG